MIRQLLHHQLPYPQRVGFGFKNMISGYAWYHILVDKCFSIHIYFIPPSIADLKGFHHHGEHIRGLLFAGIRLPGNSGQQSQYAGHPQIFSFSHSCYIQQKDQIPTYRQKAGWSWFPAQQSHGL